MSDRFADQTLIARAPEALSRRTLDGVLVLAPAMSDALQLTTPGDLIWALLAEPLTMPEMLNTLSEYFDVPADSIRSDIGPVLDALDDGGALTLTDSRG